MNKTTRTALRSVRPVTKLILLVVTSFAQAGGFFPAEDTIPKPGEPSGLVCGSIVIQTKGSLKLRTDLQNFAITVVREHGSTSGVIRYHTEWKNRRNQIMGKDEWIMPFCQRLIPGRYFFTKLSKSDAFAKLHANEWPLKNISFTVDNNSSIYLGELRAQSEDYKGIGLLGVGQDFYVISDQFERDRVLFKKYFNDLATEEIERAIIEVPTDPEIQQVFRSSHVEGKSGG